ncbi:MAG: hypothetical protein J7K02_02945 [Deltaproteobacteria bacterium]|nr:hypothetical protein [Deltaproteobacteria bacterium]
MRYLILDALDKKWKVRWGLISEHLSHANSSNRKDPRAEKRENPQWDVETYHCELIGALEIYGMERHEVFSKGRQQRKVKARSLLCSKKINLSSRITCEDILKPMPLYLRL